MEAIKKKMQAMRAEKESAVERAESAEVSAKEANHKAEKVSFIGCDNAIYRRKNGLNSKNKNKN